MCFPYTYSLEHDKFPGGHILKENQHFLPSKPKAIHNSSIGGDASPGPPCPSTRILTGLTMCRRAQLLWGHESSDSVMCRGLLHSRPVWPLAFYSHFPLFCQVPEPCAYGGIHEVIQISLGWFLWGHFLYWFWIKIGGFNAKMQLREGQSAK